MADPWLQDPPGVKKMFTLAGFVPSAKVSLEQIRSRKEDIIANIRYEKYLIETNCNVFSWYIGSLVERLLRLMNGMIESPML